jgi:hypothetical protein
MRCNDFAYWFWEPVERFVSYILDHLKIKQRRKEYERNY